MILNRTTLDRLKNQHEVIGILISGLSESELKFRPIPEKWSVKDNIAHLTCYQPRFISRTKKILEVNNPSFPAYIPEEDPEFPNFLSMSIDELVARQKEKREEIAALISNLNDEQLNRTGSHAKFGKMNMIEWTEFFLLHEAHHLHTIFKLVRSQKSQFL